MIARTSRLPPIPRLNLGNKPEDTSVGCRAMATADQERAAALGTDRMRFRLERSAHAWTIRADLLERFESSFHARAAHIAAAAATRKALAEDGRAALHASSAHRRGD